jgi:HrpA-like RNA helicase
VLAARDEGCLPEALVIASALAVPDPRERPLERAQAADQAHLRFRDDRSDFLSLVALWEFFTDLGEKKLSHRRLVDACRAQFVSFLRLIEWRDVHRQLVAVLEEAGWKWNPALPKAFDATHYQRLHRAVLAGLLGNVGVKADADESYLGARGLRFYLHPGSGLARKGGKWILAAELTETTRLYARCAAKVEPEWIEAVAGDRVTRDYFEPHWEERRGEVVASERVSLYGLTLVARRPVSFGAIDPAVAREVFIREALVTGALRTRGAFLAHNRALIDDVAELEHKARRQDVLVDDETIAAFYAERLPPGVHSAATFERWRADAERKQSRLLFLTRDYLMRHAASAVTVDLFPETLELAGTTLPLKYRFTPGHPLDGLTLTVPLRLLNQLPEERLTWLVPGMVREKVTHYLKALPKALRNRVIPLPEIVTAFLETAQDATAPLPDAIRAFLEKRLATQIAAAVLRDVELPAHLQVNVAVVDDAGAELASGRDVAALRDQLGQAAQLSFAASDPAFERKGMKQWDFGDLPESLTVARGGSRITGYPAIVDDGDSVSLALFDTAPAAERSTRNGVVRLLTLALREVLSRYDKGEPGFAEACTQAQGGDPHRPPAGGRAHGCAGSRLPCRRSAAADGKGLRRAGQARTHTPARRDGRRLSPPGRDRRSLSGPDPAHGGLAQDLGPADGRNPGGTRRTCPPGLLCADPVGAAYRSASLPVGPGPAACQVPGTARPGRAPRRAGRPVVAPLRRAGRAGSGGRPRGPAPRGLPVASRGAAGVAVCPGAQDPVSGIVQAGGEGVAGVVALTPASRTRSWAGVARPSGLLVARVQPEAAACRFASVARRRGLRPWLACARPPRSLPCSRATVSSR